MDTNSQLKLKKGAKRSKNLVAINKIVLDPNVESPDRYRTIRASAQNPFIPALDVLPPYRGNSNQSTMSKYVIAHYFLKPNLSPMSCTEN